MTGEMRQAFGHALLDLGRERPDLVVLDADIAHSFRTSAFTASWPERHFNFGVAEQGMFLAAAGLSTLGLIPLACTFASFVMRACEQIRNFICYPKLNVKIIGSHGGIEVGCDGPTHQSTEDLAVMRAMPNMTVVAPADVASLQHLLPQVVAIEGPVYLRLVRGSSPVVYDEGQDKVLAIGKASLLRDGDDVALIAVGRLVPIALDAAEMLARDGIRARVLDMHTLKPLDTAAVAMAALETGAIVTAEDHTVIGGLGGAVAECLAGMGVGRLVRVGVQDAFAQSGDPAALYERYGLSASHVVQAGRRALETKPPTVSATAACRD